VNDAPFTRRTLIKAGAAAGATLLLPIDLAVAGPSGDPAYLERSSYAGLTGPGFTARGNEQSVPLTLDAIGDLGDAAPGAEDAFSLRFSAPAATALTQGIRTISHPSLGSFDVFIAPVAQPDARQGYEVIVDRSRGAVRPAPTAPVEAAPAASAAATPDPSHEAVVARPATRHPVHRTVRHATLRRHAHGLDVGLEFEHGAAVRTVKAIVMHRGRTVTSGHRHVSGSHAGLHLTPRHRAARGAYDLLTITTDRHGLVTSQVTPVTLH
jgi:hypothetical protein